MTEPRPAWAPDAPTLEATAAAVGGYRWLSAQLFEVLGGWVASVPEPAVAVALAAQAHHHAWHAELWAERLPRVAHLDADVLTAPPGGAAVGVVEALRSLTDTTDRLAALGRVLLPRLGTALHAHLARTAPAADRGLARTLRLVLADVEADWHECEALLESHLGDEGAVRRAAAVHGDLEVRLVARGGWELGPSRPGANP